MSTSKSLEKNSRETFVKGLFGFSMPTWINCIIEFVSIPIITYFFAPDEFGKISMFLVYVDLFLSFSYLGLDQAFTRFYNEPTGKNTKKSLLTVCMSGSMISCIVIVAVIFFMTDSISVAILGEVNYAIPICVSLGVIAQCILRYFRLTSRMQKNVLIFTIQSVVLTWIKKISFIFIAFKSATALPAIITIAACSIGVTVIFFFIRLKTDFSFKCDYSKEAILPILTYSTPLIFVEIITKLNNRISQLVLNEYTTKSNVGIYSNAVTIASIITVIQQGFSSYWTPFVYENYNQKVGKKRIEKVHHMITFIMTCFGLAIILFQFPIYKILVNEKYWGSRSIFAFLLISPLCYTISETLGLGIHLSKKTYWHILICGVNIVLNISLCVLLVPRIGVVGAAFSSAISAIVNMILKTVIGEKYYKCTSSYWRMIVSLVILLVAGFVNYFLQDTLLKYPIFLVSILFEIFIYRKEFVKLFTVVMSILNKLIKKRSV